jgi:flagellar basal-body rod modification protein FlgD
MSVTAPSAVQTAAATTTSTSSSKTKSADTGQKFDYMQLIVAQMRNLNPMDPSSGGDSLPTMMQAESLNQLTQLNQALTDLQTMTQTSFAAGLVGKKVSGVDETNVTRTGAVTGLRMDAAGPVLQLSGGGQLRLTDLSDIDAS